MKSYSFFFRQDTGKKPEKSKNVTIRKVFETSVVESGIFDFVALLIINEDYLI